MGSPPPMRGKGCYHGGLHFFAGITPAYAGKSSCDWFSRSSCWDHPRLCGEKNHPTLSIIWLWGSPPPMRGKGSDEQERQQLIGITPAYAGKRYSKFKTLGAKRDHPRLCGEKTSASQTSNNFVGSPPPMRRKGTPCKYPVRADRITPAYAGKSS